jgi:glycosyltransferase involved in cell wall biosynthesis
MTTVLQIIPSLGAGGAEQACIDVAAGLQAAGHKAIVVSSGGFRVAEITALGGEHIVKNVQSKNPAVMLANAFWLANIIRKHKVDIVHARSRAPAWSAIWACGMTGCSFVTTNHAAYKFSNAAKKFYNSVMVKADRVIAISEFLADHICKNYDMDASRIRIIPRGIAMDKFSPGSVDETRLDAVRRAWDTAPGERIILAPSRISPIKGQNVLIEAMASLPPSCDDITAVILGDDQGRVEYRRELTDLIATKGLQWRVRMVSHCSDMPAAYSLAALLVAPSLVPEGFGRVPVEAMAMKVPVVATDLGGFSETLKDSDFGALVPPGDARHLAAAIAALLDQDPQSPDYAARAQAAHDRVAALYDTRKMVADTLKVYAELDGVR